MACKAVERLKNKAPHLRKLLGKKALPGSSLLEKPSDRPIQGEEKVEKKPTPHQKPETKEGWNMPYKQRKGKRSSLRPGRRPKGSVN